MSKLSDFMTKNKIDARRVVAASKSLEGLSVADRQVKLARRLAKSPTATDAMKEAAKAKKKTGRPVSPPTLDAALRGDKLSRLARQRITRAMNHLLAQKKKDAVTAKDLF